VRAIDKFALVLSAAGMGLLLGIIAVTQYRGPLGLAPASLQASVGLLLAGVILYCSAGDEKLP
jgi:hypothetical protein